MAIYKEQSDIKILREAGRRLASILDEVAKDIRPGVTERELDKKARELIEEGGDTPAFLGYSPDGASKQYPATLCVSVNDEVVHGIPNNRALKDGDVVALDIGLSHDGVITDMAKTYAVGKVSKSATRLISATRISLEEGIKATHVGGHVGDIGYAIEAQIKKAGFKVVSELGGHGVGKKVHETPFIPNFGTRGKGAALVLGMALALEPIVTEGSPEIKLASDGYTYKTKDGSIAAHFEHTILITKRGAEIITKQ